MKEKSKTVILAECKDCGALCCKACGHEYAVLLDITEVHKYKHVKSNCFGEYFIMYKNNKCPYLKDNLCSIYDNRPRRCREYSCKRIKYPYEFEKLYK
jgi:hypothetical protein